MTLVPLNISFNGTISPATLDASTASTNNYTVGFILPNVASTTVFTFNATLFLDFNGFSTSRQSINFNQTVANSGLIACDA